MLRQFTLPEDEQPISEEEITQIGKKTLKLLEAPFTGRSLSFNQRTVLADLYLGTIESKVTLGEQIQQDLAVKAKKASAFAGSLKRALSQGNNGHSGLQTISIKYPENRKLTGYYLRVVPDPHQEQETMETGPSPSEITEKIREIRLALLRQVQPADEEKDAIPIEDGERQIILETIEDIRQEVERAFAMTPHGLRQNTRALIKILLEASERGEAIMPSAIAEKIGESPEKTSLAIRKTMETLKRSHRINLAVKAQREQRHGQQFGYYLALKNKKEPQESHEEPTLPASTNRNGEAVSRSSKQMLAQLIDRAIKQTHEYAYREIIIFNALKSASAQDKQITQEYCRYIEYQIFGKTSPGRNFKDKLTEMQKISEAQFGFTIEKTGPNAWQAVPAGQKVLRPILAEIAEEEAEVAKRDPTELKKRVQAGLKHLRVKDKKDLRKALDILIQAYTDTHGIPVKEISKRAKIKITRAEWDRWTRRLKEINEDLPELLGFNVIEDGAEKYRLELTEHYIPTELDFSGRAATYPISVEEGTNFDKDAFNKIMSAPENRRAARMAPRTRIALDIIAAYSEKGQAISACYWNAELSKSAKPDPAKGQNLKIAVQNLLGRITNGKVTLHAYKLCTWYLSVDEPATERPIQAPTETPQAKQQKPKQPKTIKPAKAQPEITPTKPQTTPPKQQPAKPQPKPARAPAPQPAKPKPTPPAPRPVKPKPAPANPKPTPRPKTQRPKNPQFLEIEEGFGAVTGEILNPAAIIEEHDDDDDDNYPHIPTTPLIEFQNEIINTARTILNSKIATLESLNALEAAVQELDTGKQPHLERTKQAYLAKLKSATKRAAREIATALSQNPQAASLIPEYLTDQLFSI